LGFGTGFSLLIETSFMKKQEKTKRPSRKKPSNETVHERVRRHLSDKNSVITDEDIRNVKTELTIRGETSPESGRNPE